MTVLPYVVQNDGIHDNDDRPHNDWSKQIAPAVSAKHDDDRVAPSWWMNHLCQHHDENSEGYRRTDRQWMRTKQLVEQNANRS